jgi:hypothetical protein
MAKLNITRLKLSWATSRGKDTYGYNICRLDDTSFTGKRYRCNGGGYDMVGTCLGMWVEDVKQAELAKLAHRVHYDYTDKTYVVPKDRLYSLTKLSDGTFSIDGACGVNSVIAVLEALGYEVQNDYPKRKLEGYYISKEVSDEKT